MSPTANGVFRYLDSPILSDLAYHDIRSISRRVSSQFMYPANPQSPRVLQPAVLYNPNVVLRL